MHSGWLSRPEFRWHSRGVDKYVRELGIKIRFLLDPCTEGEPSFRSLKDFFSQEFRLATPAPPIVRAYSRRFMLIRLAAFEKSVCSLSAHQSRYRPEPQRHLTLHHRRPRPRGRSPLFGLSCPSVPCCSPWGNNPLANPHKNQIRGSRLPPDRISGE